MDENKLIEKIGFWVIIVLMTITAGLFLYNTYLDTKIKTARLETLRGNDE